MPSAGTMTVMIAASGLPPSGPLKAADLGTMPDDGHGHELLDGSLIVTPGPAVPHQRVVGNLYLRLREACPDDLEVMLTPLDIALSEITALQPDLLVAPRDALEGAQMVGLPVLAIEVLAPSTRLIDLILKRAAFERAGVASYWAVDPDRPSITAWRLDGDEYVSDASAKGDESFRTDAPFPIELRPEELAR